MTGSTAYTLTVNSGKDWNNTAITSNSTASFTSPGAPPTVVLAAGRSPTTILVKFSSTMASSSMTNATNYVISGGGSVASASSANNTSVTLDGFLADKLGFTPPPYPGSLKVTGLGGCELTAVLEFQDGTSPWYYVMVPNADWPATGTAPSIVFRYPDDSKNLYTNGIQLPGARHHQRVLDRLRRSA